MPLTNVRKLKWNINGDYEIMEKVNNSIHAEIDISKSTSISDKKARMVPMIMDKPVLRVKDLCDLLEIKIPFEYKNVGDKYVTDTSLFEGLEEKDQMISEMKLKKDLAKGYYKVLKLAAGKFKNRFLNVSGEFEKTDLQMLEMFVEWQYVFRTRGFWFQDYFDYHLYERSIEEAQKFISADYRFKIADATITKGYAEYFSDKSIFNETFSKFVKRDFLNTRNCTFNEFKNFINKHPTFFGKPCSGTGGFGAGIWNIENDLVRLFEKCKDQDLILEEIVRQHQELAEYNIDTLNTVRIYSLLPFDNEPIITLATIRFGREGSAVDNFHSGGVGAAVNVKTGVIYTEAIDLNGNRYLNHPDSGKKVKGFKIPNWNKSIAAVKEAAMLIPQIRHVGWDIAFKENGEIEFMEGNTKANFHIPQSADQIGKRFLYEKYIVELLAKKLEEDSINKADFEYQLIDDQVKITRYIGNNIRLDIPEIIQGKEVTVIGAKSFANLSFLKSVTIPETVVTIYREAFKNCSALKSIELPESLTVLNAEAFKGCTSLESVGLPYILKRICQSTFEDCTSLNQFYYFSKRGISSVMSTDRNLRENQLPTDIEYIGNRAFRNCTSLEEITIPYKVHEIRESVFENCSSLKKVHIHNLLKVVKKNAFLGCKALKEIRLPRLLKTILINAFDPETILVCESNTVIFKYAKKHGLSIREISKLDAMPQLSSQMIPYSHNAEFIPLEVYKPFYTDVELREIIEKYEMRMPSYELIQRESKGAPLPVRSARYVMDSGIYRNKIKTTPHRAVIMMTADLMCRKRQQKFVHRDGNFHFDDSFYFVKDLISQSDFAVGNMETMISPSSPFTFEKEHVNARPHLNSPESFLGAIRNASFDAVINAQNHIYDTGTLGILETLDMQNKYELMHTGAFASPSDKRYLIVEVNHIKIAILSYFDGARQLMKKANFTRLGRKVLLSIYEIDQVNKDIKNAKDEGAEFIIAYCHWGREYTHDTSERQRGFAMEVANAGVDFIFGAHSHCVQPYEEIHTRDDRVVSVVYSGGNFLSDINIHAPITRDTLISELILVKNDAGNVRIESNGYYPCRILELGERRKNYAVVPTQVKFKRDPVLTRKSKDSEKRIESVLGSKIKKCTPKGIALSISLRKTPFDYRTG